MMFYSKKLKSLEKRIEQLEYTLRDQYSLNFFINKRLHAMDILEGTKSYLGLTAWIKVDDAELYLDLLAKELIERYRNSIEAGKK